MAKKTNEPLEAIKKTQTAEKEQIKADESGELETVKEKRADETGQQSEAKEGETETTEIGEQLEAKKEAKTKTTAKSQTAKEKAKKEIDEFTRAAKAKQEKDAAFIAPYTKAYPGEKVFHVTSDKQVFLEKDRGLAVLHQNSLGTDEKVQTIKVK